MSERIILSIRSGTWDIPGRALAGQFDDDDASQGLTRVGSACEGREFRPELNGGSDNVRRRMFACGGSREGDMIQRIVF
jgi:hypothetical protein